MKKFWNTIKDYVYIILAVVLIRSFVVTPALVDGASMDETLKDGELVLINKFVYIVSDINRYDEVVVNNEEIEEVNGKYRIVGVEYGTHTIEVYGKDGNRIGEPQSIIVSKGVEENTSFTNNTITLTGATNNVSVDLKLENGNYKVDTSSIETVKPEANAPVLAEGMIPVVYDGTNWVVANSTNWYDYDNQKWANAVILFDNKSYKVGEEIPESNIKEYYVWIPKYSYRLWNVNSDNTNNVGKPIEIVFGSKASTTGENNGDMYLHPAFTNFNTYGIWVGKFEVSYNEETYTNQDLLISNALSCGLITQEVYDRLIQQLEAEQNGNRDAFVEQLSQATGEIVEEYAGYSHAGEHVTMSMLIMLAENEDPFGLTGLPVVHAAWISDDMKESCIATPLRGKLLPMTNPLIKK